MSKKYKYKAGDKVTNDGEWILILNKEGAKDLNERHGFTTTHNYRLATKQEIIIYELSK